jgi:hypothetical protein
MKRLDIINMKPALSIIANIKLKASTSSRIAYGLNKVQSVIRSTQTKQHAVYERLGSMSADNLRYDIPDAAQPEFQKAMNDIMEEDVELVVRPIALADLGDIQIEPGHIAALLGTFITEDDATA